MYNNYRYVMELLLILLVGFDLLLEREPGGWWATQWMDTDREEMEDRSYNVDG